MPIKLPKFSSKKAAIDYLVSHKKELIEFKRSEFKSCDNVRYASDKNVIKALNTSYVDDIESGILKRSIIANTYYWMDSHDDVHLNNLFSKSISERKDKIFHLHDHLFQLTAKVGNPTAIYERNVSWSDLNINKEGSTQILVLDSDILKEYNERIFKGYVRGEIDQHSVGMGYVKLDLAVNDPSYELEYKIWQSVFPLLGNPEKADSKGYFWAISEAKLYEISSVLEGSNELTWTMENINSLDTNQPDDTTGKGNEPKNKQINYQFLTENFKLN